MTTQQINNQIKTFREKLPEFTEETKDVVKEWEFKLTKIERIQEIARNPVIREMVVEYSEEIKAVEHRLINEERMKEIVRIRLFARKNACQRFVDIFNIENRIEDLYKLVKEQNDAAR